MSIDAKEVETVILTLAKGVAVVFPASAPVIGIITTALAALEAAGIVPTPTSAVNVEQVRAQAAGIAAAEASAATAARAHAEATKAQTAADAPKPVPVPLVVPQKVAPRGAHIGGNGSDA